ncbi:ABC transporter ATP-binding protein [Nakamurella leprariae]|uniref:ABC transporter ATP-binding protein n=1 Tax=Nakamurella leprariae TaxID=2803911 RepID=A0A939BXJ0_9ACTN|nr:ABC transporter ATP-binding protein [Nakamurella leprariae]MBM9468608.1 ABC transporter ATP-binding protein [Nakamurella leprariae]
MAVPELTGEDLATGADLTVTDVTVGYPGSGLGGRRSPAVVLRDLNLTARAGRVTVLLGANGCGKSTLLRSIAGLQPVLGGTVRLGVQDLLALPPRERAARLAVVLTDRFDPGLLRGADVVELGRYPHRRPAGGLRPADREAIDTAVAAVRAAHLLERPLARMSDGQRQRILIARALAQQPGALLLDEPTAFLDAPARLELLAVLGRIAAQRSIPVLVTSHDVELAVRADGDAWLIGGGRTVSGPLRELAADGSIAAAFDTPAVEWDADGARFRLR